MPAGAKTVAVGVVQLGRERAGAHTGRIGLGNADHFADPAGRHAEAVTDAGGHRIRRGDEGIGTEVDIEHRTLRAFGQHALALIQSLVDVVFAIDLRQPAQGIETGEPLFLFLLKVEVDRRIHLEQAQVFAAEAAVFFLEIRQQDIAHPDAVSAGLVHIGRPDALQGGTDLLDAFGRFGGGVEVAMRRQDEVCLLGDEQALAVIDPERLQLIEFLFQGNGIDDHAIADQIDQAVAKDPGRHGMQDEFLPVELERMSGVRTALKAGHKIILLGQVIYDLPLSLVAPLQAQNYVDIHWFVVLPKPERSVSLRTDAVPGMIRT